VVGRCCRRPGNRGRGRGRAGGCHGRAGGGRRWRLSAARRWQARDWCGVARRGADRAGLLRRSVPRV